MFSFRTKDWLTDHAELRGIRLFIPGKGWWTDHAESWVIRLFITGGGGGGYPEFRTNHAEFCFTKPGDNLQIGFKSIMPTSREIEGAIV